MPQNSSPKHFTLERRTFLAGLAGLACFAGLCALPRPLNAAEALGFSSSSLLGLDQTELKEKLSRLEAISGGRLGTARLDCATGRLYTYRGEEVFPVCSTFKVLVAAAVLKQHPHRINELVHYEQAKIISWSPVTEKHVNTGMTVGALCAAAVQYSDNTAANLLLEMIGGPAGLTAFARSIGDSVFRLDRIEPALNQADPGDMRDTSSPAAMAWTLNALLMNDILSSQHRALLQEWLMECATGASRIPAGVPSGWKVGHKTGGGHNGTANDVGILLPPTGKPIILALYLTQSTVTESTRDGILAEATRLLCLPAG